MAEKSRLACDPAQSRGRLFPEDKPFERSEFQRDRDRIIHSTAFRRLEYKTQVFVNHEGDHYRTRLTHSLEVAQFARSMSRSLGLNEDLAEAIALSHDLGHTPFGHAGEDALKTVYPDFDHNGQSLKIVTKLEDKYAEFDGLNLSWETLEGIAKHNGPDENPPKEVAKFNQEFDLEMSGYASLEAQLAGWADDIAYSNHDIDDGLRAKLFTIEDLLHLPLVGEMFKEVMDKYPGIDEERIRHEAIRRVISKMVADVLIATKARIEGAGVKSVEDVRALGKPLAGFSDEMLDLNKQVKAWLMKNMYRHERVNKMTSKAREVVKNLYIYFADNPDELAREWRQKLERDADLNETVADYIAGMTDRYALDEYEKIYG